jgi:hypothetical protein
LLLGVLRRRGQSGEPHGDLLRPRILYPRTLGLPRSETKLSQLTRFAANLARLSRRLLVNQRRSPMRSSRSAMSDEKTFELHASGTDPHIVDQARSEHTS